MPQKKFNRRYVWRWRSGAHEESDNVFDLPFTWQENVDWELDSAL
jgi:hypothetical protein